MNATVKLTLFLLSLFLLFGGIGLQTAYSNSLTAQVSEPEAQATVPPLPTLPIATEPADPPPGGGGGGGGVGGLSTTVIVIIAIALIAVVGLVLAAMRGGGGSSSSSSG